MMPFPKFIIEDGCLIIAKVLYHKQLVENKDNVRGGGWFRYDRIENTFTFHGQSEDFGKATLEDIKKCVDEGRVYNRIKTRCIIDKHSFYYDTGTEIIELRVINKAQ